MTISSKKSVRKAASVTKKAAPAKQRYSQLGEAARKKVRTVAKREYARTPIHERTKNKVAWERQQEQLPLTDEPWLTLRQCAARVGFAYNTVARWTQKRENGLRFRRFGRTIKVPISELERFSGGPSKKTAAA
jgi:hypothetical protein